MGIGNVVAGLRVYRIVSEIFFIELQFFAKTLYRAADITGEGATIAVGLVAYGEAAPVSGAGRVLSQQCRGQLRRIPVRLQCHIDVSVKEQGLTDVPISD